MKRLDFILPAAMAGLCVCCSLVRAAGATSSPQWRQTRLEPRTQHFDLAAGATVRLQNSTGELTVEGWDQPGVEVTTTLATPGSYSEAAAAKARGILDQVKITSGQNGNELVIATGYPHRAGFPGTTRLHGVPTGFQLEYRIHIPRSARLAVDHNEGEVHVEGMAGAVQVANRQGEITVDVPAGAACAVSANSAAGSVISDFEGSETRHRLLGHSFAHPDPAAACKLDLHMGYGDIVVLRMSNPALPVATRP